MTNFELIEVKEFLLCYDGMYQIKFEVDAIKYEKYVFLPLEMLLNILEREELPANQFDMIKMFNDGVLIRKTILYLMAQRENSTSKFNFLTSVLGEHLQENDYYLLNVQLNPNKF